MAVAEVHTTTGSAGPDPASDEPGARGSLIIKDRALAKIATTAALHVPGVVAQRGGLTRLTGRDLPRADVSSGADSVAINLYLGVRWPCDVAELTRRVHGEVGNRVATLAGLPLHQLGVFVAGTDGTDTGTENSDGGPVPIPSADVTLPRPPTAPPAAVPAAIAIAIALLALAAVAARELLIVRGTLSGAPWLRNTFEWASRLHWDTWLVPVSLTALVVGVLCVLLALSPRARTHVPTRSDAGAPTVWLRPVDIARLCSVRAGTVPGVASAHTTVDRRRATVHVVPVADGPTPDLADAVTSAVSDALSVLGGPLKLRVHVRRARSTS